MQKRYLILLTANFPFGTGETFLENEITYLCQGFEKVTLVAISKGNGELRSVPDNCEVLSFDQPITSLTKIKSLKGIFSTYFWEELQVIQKVYKKPLTKGILSTLLVSLYQAQRIAKYVKNRIVIDARTVLYSYWCDDTAIALALLKKEYPATNMVSRMHRWDIYFEESKVNYLPLRHLIASQLKIVSISQDGIDYAIEKWKVQASSFILSRLGIDAQFPKIENRSPAYFTIISCSNVIKVKRVALIVNALALIKDIPIRWIHFGDGVLMDNLKKQIEKLPSNIQVKLKGRIPNKEIYKAYHELKPHLFVNVSSSEGVPVSIMEAMSFGIPVLATDVGGNNEIVNQQNGKLLTSDPTVNEIKQAIHYFIDLEESEYQNYANNAYFTWRKEYNAKKNYIDFLMRLTS